MFLEAFLFYLCVYCCFVLCVRLVYLSCCIYNRKTHKHIKHKKKKTTRRKQTKQKNKQKYIISQLETERYLFAVGSWAGYPVSMFLCLCFSRSFSVLFFCFCLFVCMCSPSLFKLLHLQSNKTNITTEQNKQSFVTIHRNPLLWKGISYCRRKPLTPLLYKQILYYRMTSLAIEGSPLL